MIYEASLLAVIIFFVFLGITLGLSFFLGRQAKSSAGYFAAHGQIPWFVNGVAFAGDYLSAASFLGICGMIAFYGYDGFLYSIGFLAGWIVALFVVAEPIKRLGRFTFADALNAKFQSKSIELAAGVSTLAVSIFYLIPQMVGAGVLVKPLLGFDQWIGVVLVGAVVIMIVVTAGMVSTTWVQFLKGTLLVIFSTILTGMILARGFTVESEETAKFRELKLSAEEEESGIPEAVEAEFGDGWEIVPPAEGWKDRPFIRVRDKETGELIAFHRSEGSFIAREAQLLSINEEGRTLVNGLPMGKGENERQLKSVGSVHQLPGYQTETGPLNPISFFQRLQYSSVVLWRNETIQESDGTVTTVYYQKLTKGEDVLQPGENPKFKGIRSKNPIDKINFLSLMLALFCGTASLPHILIRYYTVKDESSARKSTIVGIATIGFFYVLTLYMGLGAMTSGAMDPTNSNMAAPLLAKSINEWLFAIISAIAFTTVLGTVSGLILASAGAVTHDLVANLLPEEMNDYQKVRLAKISSVIVGGIAIVLGILFQKLNVGYLVGWAFSIAASANLPTLVMLLYWKGTTKQGIVAAIIVGMVSSLGWILLSGDTYAAVYGLPAEQAIVPFSQPGIVTIPLGFVTLVVVSLLTGKKGDGKE